MKKNKVISLILGIVGAALIIGGLYFLIYYMNYFGQGFIEFVSANNVETISRCGIVVPDMFLQLRDKFATAILPILYLGIPISVIVISVIWFLSGYYFGKNRVEEELAGKERRKKEMEEEIQKRVEKKKENPKEEFEEYKEEIEEEEIEEKPAKSKRSKKR